MSKIRRRLVSALVAATSVGGGAGLVSNVACASTVVSDPGISATYALNNLVDNVKGKGGFDSSQIITSSVDGGAIYIPCRNGVETVDWNTAQNIMGSYGKRMETILSELAPASSYSKDLKKYDNRLTYGSLSNFMPWLPGKYLDKLNDVTSVAKFVLKNSKSVSDDEREKGLKSMKKFLGEKAFKNYKANLDSRYDFGAICSALYDLSNEFNKYCDDVRKLVKDGLPVDTTKVNVGVLSEYKDTAGFWSSLFGGKENVYNCVVNLTEAVLDLFTK